MATHANPKEKLHFGITPSSSSTMSPSSSPFSFKLQSNSTLKILKQHCVFYDLLVQKEINDMINNYADEQLTTKYDYYKGLFEEKFDDYTGSLTPENVTDFFEINELLAKDEKLIDYFGTNGTKDTLFIIPVFLDNDENISVDDLELFEQNKRNPLKNYEVYKTFYETLKGVSKKKNGETDDKPSGKKIYATPMKVNRRATTIGDNENNTTMEILPIYHLPCLIRKEMSKISETEYVKKLQTELLKLQDFLRDYFLEKINKSENSFKNISFFCDPNGQISLNFYKSSLSQKNIELVNKHLFKELGHLKGNIQEGKQTFIMTEVAKQPAVYRKSKKQINKEFKEDNKSKFLVFLVQKILNGEILSKFKNFELSDKNGIQKLNILYTTKIKKDLNDFNIICNHSFRFTEKAIGDFHFDFKLHENECRHAETYKAVPNIFQKYWKLKVQDEVKSSITNGDDDLYLRVTSVGVLKQASLYIKTRNIYEEKKKGIIQIVPTQSSYKHFKISNLTRIVDSTQVYYYENFNFTMDSFDKYIKNYKITNTNRGSGKIPKETIRKLFIETFTNMSALNDYFLFCMNDPKLKSTIDLKFYDIETTEQQREAQRTKIINLLVRQLFKKGSIFYTNQSQNEQKLDIGDKKDVLYNKYRIKKIQPVIVQLYGTNKDMNNGSVIREMKAQKLSDKKILTDVQKMITKNDHALVCLNLEEDTRNKNNHETTNNNTNGYMVKNLNSEKCSKRRKTIKNTFQKLIKNITQKIHFRLRAFT